MSDVREEIKTKRFRLAAWQIASVCLFLLILLFIVWRLVLIALVDREIARIRAEGYPTTGAELNAYYKPVPAEKNAAIVYERSQALMRPHDLFSKHFQPQYCRDDNPDRIKMGSDWRLHVGHFLQNNAEALDQIETVRDSSQTRFKIDYTNEPTIAESRFLIHQVEELILFRGEYADELGDTDTAIRWIGHGWTLYESLESEPSGYGEGTQGRVLYDCVYMTGRLLDHSQLTDSQLCRLEQMLLAIHFSENAERYIAGERVDALEQMGHCESLWKRALFDWPYQIYSQTGLMEVDKLQCLAIIRKYFEINQLKESQRRNAAQQLEKQINGLPAMFILSRRAASSRFDFFVAGWTETHIGCLRTAVAIERYRLARKKMPRSLDELVPRFLPSLPVDPFSRSSAILGDIPFKFEPFEDGYDVHGVDPNIRLTIGPIVDGEPTTLQSTPTQSAAQR